MRNPADIPTVQALVESECVLKDRGEVLQRGRFPAADVLVEVLLPQEEPSHEHNLEPAKFVMNKNFARI